MRAGSYGTVVKRLIAVVLCAAVVLAGVGIAPCGLAKANTDVWEGPIASRLSGGGTKDDPYLISNGAELAYLDTLEYDNDFTLEDMKYYKLTSDIDLGTEHYWNGINYFKGYFDGDGHTIKNMTIVNPTVLSGQNDAAGLFRVVSGGSVRNLTVEGSISITDDYGDSLDIGGIAGVLSYSMDTSSRLIPFTMFNCCSKVRITITGIDQRVSVGGVAGCTLESNANHSRIVLCRNEEDISISSSAEVFAGGIIGSCSNCPTMIDLRNSGSITCSTSGAAKVGGIVGGIEVIGGLLKNASNTGEVRVSASREFGAGGLIGSNSGATQFMLENGYNSGAVTVCGHENLSAGGIVGEAGYEQVYKNCYNRGDIKSEAPSTKAFCLFGDPETGPDTESVFNCYNSENAQYTRTYFGGYYREYDGTPVSDSVPQSDYEGFNFNTTWKMGSNGPLMRAGTASDPFLAATWSDLYELLQAGGYIKLNGTILYGTGNDVNKNQNLVVPEGIEAIIDLNGCTIDRGLGEAGAGVVDGRVLKVEGELTIEDSSDVVSTPVYDGTGKITGGWCSGNLGESPYGGGILVSGGEVTINGGSVEENRAVKGGGVYVGLPSGVRGRLIFNNGRIASNKSSNHGAGVYVLENTYFLMTGGVIENNIIDPQNNYGGGGVFSAGSFSMEGGVIRRNSSPNGYCGGVYIHDGSFAMTNAEISENSAEIVGGIEIDNSETTVIKNSTITGNTATEDCGGILIHYEANVTISGNTSIKDNFLGALASNCFYTYANYHPDYQPFIVSEPLLGNIGISVGNIVEQHVAAKGDTYTLTVEDLQHLVSDRPDQYLIGLDETNNQAVLCAGITIDDIPDQSYTGSAISPAVIVKHDGTALVAGTDYTVTYSNNTARGDALAKIQLADETILVKPFKIVSPGGGTTPVNPTPANPSQDIGNIPPYEEPSAEEDTDEQEPDTETAEEPEAEEKVVLKSSSKNGKITLKWNAVEGATRYRIYQKVGGKLKKIKTLKKNRYVFKKAYEYVKKNGKKTLKLKKLTVGKKYTFVVKAFVDGKWTDVTEDATKTVRVKGGK